MGDPDDALVTELKRDARKRDVKVLVIVGVVLLLVGAGVFGLGLTFEEPAERLATKPVPRGAEYALMIGGVLLALAGVGMLVKSVRAARGPRG